MFISKIPMHPFDLKAALLAKHAQHVVLIHFPIALFLTGVAFDLCALRVKRTGLAEAAYFNFLVAAVMTLPVLASGLMAWQWQLDWTFGRISQRGERTGVSGA